MIEPSSVSSNADTVAGLRALATWLEQHPDLSLSTPTLQLAAPHATDESLPAFADIAALHTRFDVDAESGEAEAIRQFGPVQLRLLDWDSAALRFVRKVAGKR